MLYVKGCVPGHENTTVRVMDAKRKPHKTPPPFPTRLLDPTMELEEESFSDEIHKPFEPSIEFPSQPKEKRKRK